MSVGPSWKKLIRYTNTTSSVTDKRYNTSSVIDEQYTTSSFIGKWIFSFFYFYPIGTGSEWTNDVIGSVFGVKSVFCRKKFVVIIREGRGLSIFSCGIQFPCQLSDHWPVKFSIRIEHWPIWKKNISFQPCPYMQLKRLKRRLILLQFMLLKNWMWTRKMQNLLIICPYTKDLIIEIHEAIN